MVDEFRFLLKGRPLLVPGDSAFGREEPVDQMIAARNHPLRSAGKWPQALLAPTSPSLSEKPNFGMGVAFSGSNDNVYHMIIGRMKADATGTWPARPAVQVGRWCARFEEECRKRGIRITVQRLAVYGALAADETHPTADALHARLRGGIGGLSLATVYRILESLEHEGFVRRVKTADGVGRFDANMAPHLHLVCRHCGSIMDTEVKPLGRLNLPRRGPSGFRPDSLDISVIGTCGNCRRPRGRRTKSD